MEGVFVMESMGSFLLGMVFGGNASKVVLDGTDITCVDAFTDGNIEIMMVTPGGDDITPG